MSWYDSVLSNTVGAAYRAVSGNVDPWTLQQQKDQIAVDTARALGPNADAATVAARTAQAQAEVDNFLRSTDSHPDQAGVRIPGLGVMGSPEFLLKLEKVVYVVVGVGGIAGVIYFAVKYKQIFGKR